MTETAESVQQLREQFLAAKEAGRGAEVRAAAVAYYRRRREEGATQDIVAGELGIKKWALAKWSQSRGSAAEPKGVKLSAQASDECAALRREIEALGPLNPARRFPDELKQRITRWARGALAEGVATIEVAEMIGVSWKSLSRWLGRRAPQTVASAKKLREVSVVEHAPSTPAVGAVLKSPSGYVVEGLDVATLVELLRRLG